MLKIVQLFSDVHQSMAKTCTGKEILPLDQKIDMEYSHMEYDSVFSAELYPHQEYIEQ